MPRRYVKIRNACVKRGGAKKACRTKAAKIHNATRRPGEATVSGAVKRENAKRRRKS